MKFKTGIYKITNTNNNRYYIGSSINIRKRWLEHKRLLRQNKHDNDFLQKSWNKHGEDSFVFEVLEFVEEASELIIREQYYLDMIKPFNKDTTYNICENAGNMLGFKHSVESKKNMSKVQLRRYEDPKERAKCNVFKNLTEKEREVYIKKLSESHKGIKHSSETKIKMIELSLGRGHNDETKIRLSEINKGRESYNKRKVYQLDLNNNVVKLWDSLTEAAKHFNINPSRICSSCNGRTKTCVGFKWKYLNPDGKILITDKVKNKIRDMYQTGLYSTRKLAGMFDISKSSVWSIINKT